MRRSSDPDTPAIARDLASQGTGRLLCLAIASALVLLAVASLLMGAIVA